MTETLLIQLLISGLGMGFIFVLIAIGLTLIYGVMDVVNFAHGEFLMIAMYATYLAFCFWGVDPLVTLPFVARRSCSSSGSVVYYLLIRKVLGGGHARPDLRHLRADGVPPGRRPVRFRRRLFRGLRQLAVGRSKRR